MMPFVAPDWLANQNAEAIHKRMMEMLPNDIDDTEGGFPWDFTKPTALEKAELLEFFLVETLKIMHPMWAYGRWLDYHAAVVGLERKDANKAAGILTVTGKTGTNIVAGSRFAVPSIGDNPAIVYETRRQYTIGSEGTVDIEIFAVEGGTKFNVSAGAISLMLIPIQGITTLTNVAAITGGTEEESDEELRQRINDINLSGDVLYVGSVADYARWAQEVPGVGNVFVMPEWDGAGTVKVVVLDANGQPANASILDAVNEHIMSPSNPSRRMAPVGAVATIAAPTAKNIQYTFSLVLEPGESKNTVLTRFSEALQSYYVNAKSEGQVKYTKVAALLADTDGVSDFTTLLINNKEANIIIAEDQYPVTASISVQVVSHI